MLNRNAARVLLGGRWQVDHAAGLRYLAGYLEGHNWREQRWEGLVTISQNGAQQQGDGQREQLSAAQFLLSGPMILNDGECSYGVRSLSNSILRAASRDDVGGIFLEVDSGGGQAEAGTVLQNALRDVRAMGKPVVVYTQGLMSAALKGTLFASETIAAAADIDVGSVGGYIALNAKRIKELQEETLFVYAAQSTAKNGGVRQLLETGETGILRDWVTEGVAEFIDQVEAAREWTGRTKEQKDRLQSGEVFTAREALQFGLIDGIGTRSEAVARLFELINGEPQNEATAKGGTNNQRSMFSSNIFSGFTGGLLRRSQSQETATGETEGENNPEEITQEDQGIDEGEDHQETEGQDGEAGESQQNGSQVVGVMAMLDAQQSALSQMQETIKQQAETIKSLQTTIAKLKVGQSEPKHNGATPRLSDYKTVQNNRGGVKPANGAKYQ